MKLYNSSTDSIENVQTITTADGSRYANRITEEELNEWGYHKVLYASKPNRRHYIPTGIFRLINNVYTQVYTTTERQIDDVHTLMIKDLKEAFLGYSKRPKVDTGLVPLLSTKANNLNCGKISIKNPK